MTAAATLRRTLSVPFSPSQLPNLAGWYRGDDLTGVDGVAISQWNDVSGNARHATQGTGANQPAKKTGIVNGHAVARFDGATTDYLFVDGLAGTFTGTDPAVTIALVVKAASLTGFPTYLSAANTATDPPYWDLRFDVSRHQVSKRNNANSFVHATDDTATLDTNWHVLSIVLPGTTIGVWQDGAAAITAGSSLAAGATTVDRVVIGTFWHRLGLQADPLDGDLAELCIYSRAVSDAERLQLERHLGAKYAVAVA